MVIVPHTVWGWGVCQRFEGGNEVVKMEACKHKRLGSSVICLCPLFILSSCTDVGGGKNISKQVEANLRSVSITLLHCSPVVCAAPGSTTALRTHLKRSSISPFCVCNKANTGAQGVCLGLNLV